MKLINTNHHAMGTLRLSAFLLLFCFSFQAKLVAQQQENQLAMIAHSTTDSVLLRWAPGSFQLWQQVRTKGLQLSRQTMMRDGKLLPLAERQQTTVIAQDLRPAPLAAFETAGATDDFVAIGGQAIYGESFLPQTDDADEVSLGALFNGATDQENRFSFGLYAADQSWQAATLLGLGYTDTNVRDNETYIYTLRGATGDLTNLDTKYSAFVTVKAGSNVLKTKISSLEAEFEDKVGVLSWDVEVARDFYTSYFIELSADGVSWERVNEEPFVPVFKENQRPIAFYQVPLPENNRPYFMRVIGRTPFAQDAPPSNVVQGMGKDPLPETAPSIAGAFPNEEGGFDISWTFPNDIPVNNFRVFRADNAVGIFEPLSDLLPGDARNFRDEAPMRVNYYQIAVYDQYNRELRSFVIMAQPNDTTPPETPVNLRGIITDDGKVILNWDANTEEDLLGYRIWLANTPQEEFKLATSTPLVNDYYIGETTLNTLTSSLYAKITALDIRHNPSPFTEYIEILRPDTIAPAAPLLKEVTSTTEHLDLYFATSRTPDIEQHELFRRPAGDTVWQLIRTLPFPDEKEADHYRDTDLAPGLTHEYRLDAIDRSGLRASSDVLQGKVIDDFIRQQVKKVKATPDRREHTILLDWTYAPEDDKFLHFEIFRNVPGKNPDIIALHQPPTAPSSGKKAAYQFTDPGPLKMDTDYEYRVRAVYSDGGLSRLSPAVSVNY
ncbi:fibronectin type III domain-containing protein [Neolewinella agarilytica]|uniref:fibronectin type III domain-containing protein n=1 Tax=Neolewinella agarilytica TaxID=478744 RepID=UPI002357E39C|nr:fibronectin type III domain-containing protein [Neolewinella agarilytica]